jgi:hypothetical protein
MGNIYTMCALCTEDELTYCSGELPYEPLYIEGNLCCQLCAKRIKRILEGKE